MTGTVITGNNNTFIVACGERHYTCTLKSKRLKVAAAYNALAPGDIVDITPDAFEDNKAQITSLHERKTCLLRSNPKGKGGLPQVLAANIDLCLIVVTLSQPQLKPSFLDRVIVQCHALQLKFVIVCNKIDLGADTAALQVYEDLGYSLCYVSCKTGQGLEAIASIIAGKSVALVGQSGVGKSSLINSLSSYAACPLVAKVGDISKKHGKGVHTTTCGRLYNLPIAQHDTNIIDTPGVKAFKLYKVDRGSLWQHFPDIVPYIGKCGFGLSCTHTAEKACAIRAALSSGKLSSKRWESYLALLQEL